MTDRPQLLTPIEEGMLIISEDQDQRMMLYVNEVFYSGKMDVIETTGEIQHFSQEELFDEIWMFDPDKITFLMPDHPAVEKYIKEFWRR